jgi:hypothetical protein
MENYEELEGKEIKYTNSDLNDNDNIKAVVLGCDKDIGITIIDKNRDNDDRLFYLMCLPGPSAPRHYDKDIFELFFEPTINMIKDGYYNADVTNELFYSKFNHSGSQPECPYGQ